MNETQGKTGRNQSKCPVEIKICTRSRCFGHDCNFMLNASLHSASIGNPGNVLEMSCAVASIGDCYALMKDVLIKNNIDGIFQQEVVSTLRVRRLVGGPDRHGARNRLDFKMKQEGNPF